MRLVDANELKHEIVGAIPMMATVRIPIEHKIDAAPTVQAIPVEWLRQKAEENSRYAEPYFAFAYVLHEWQQTKSIEELQAESEMRDWKAEQEAQND